MWDGTISIVMIAPLSSFSWAGKAVLLCPVDEAKEVVWWTTLEGMRTNTLVFRRGSVDFFKFLLKRRVRVERGGVLSSS